MTSTLSRGNFALMLLIAALVHVGLFFLFVSLVAAGLLSATEIDEEEPEEEPEPIQIKVAYVEPKSLAFALAKEVFREEEPEPEPELIPEEEPESEELPVPEEEAAPEPEEAEAAPELMPVEPDPDTPSFVQTNESQESEEAPEETSLIGERNTTATSDAGAVAGDEEMAALAGTAQRRSDPKTFDSDFLEGEDSGTQEGAEDLLETGEGKEAENEVAVMASEAQDRVDALDEELPEIEEELAKPKDDELAAIDDVLLALEEVIGDDEKNKSQAEMEGGVKKEAQEEVAEVEETLPEEPAKKEQDAAAQDGGFAPQATKTRVAGVLSVSGSGSLNVANTPIGKYQASILKKLESAWQIENINNRSLLAPGNVTLYFVVDRDGKVSRQRQISMNGASETQWGMILRAVGIIAIPKMPKDVIKELEGESLELVITFNY